MRASVFASSVGMLTALRIVPSSRAARIDCAISIPTLSCASAVEAPRCGVRTMFGVARSGDSAGNVSILKRFNQRVFVDQAAPGAVDDANTTPGFLQSIGIEYVMRLRRQRRVE